uniref:Solute carrier family 12 member 9 n=1 Tax=Arion vulgaris TaxID=1028688 RepID=A0A0B7B898_9EUPU
MSKISYNSTGVHIDNGIDTINDCQNNMPSVLDGDFLNLESATVTIDGNSTDTERTPLNSSPHFGQRLKTFFFGTESDSGKGYSEFSGKQADSGRTLGAFAGVFAPVALGQFASQLFLRTGFVVGNSGLLETYSQLFLAYFILIMTVLSICAISTNGAVEGGGAYYMISRALGPEFGGSIGFLFYVANVLSCALYTVGFVEGVMQNFGVGGSFTSDTTGLPVDSDWWKYLYASTSLFICLLICIVGGAMFAKTSAFILLLVVIATLSVFISAFVNSDNIEVEIPKTNDYAYRHVNETGNDTKVYGLYTGLSAKTFRDNLMSNYTIDYSTDNMMDYATVFAILFSSVTGILNGANMSGELKDPSKAIPRGTMSAVFFTFTTYIILCTLVAGTSTRFLLVNDYVYLQQVNVWKPFVVVGIFASTLSAALGNLIGGSRILQALGNDQLYWFILKPATITTKGGNPLISVFMTWFFVQLVLLIGSLNAIAPITSVFFLLSYASVNLACLSLEMASAPNFRPTFVYFSWYTCLSGMIGCMIMCFMISPIYASVSLVIMLVLAIMLHFRSLPSTWGSISQAIIFHQVRKYLLMLDSRKAHVKFWRPQILLMVANPRQSCELMDFCNDIKKSGLYVIGHVRTGKLEHCTMDPILEETPRWMQLIHHMKIKAFVELTLASTVSEGFQHLVRISGLGGMKVNTVCFGFFDDILPTDSLIKARTKKRRFFGSVDNGGLSEFESFFESPRTGNIKHLSADEYVKLILDALKIQKNVFLCRNFQQLNKDEVLSSPYKSFIDVWPVNFFRPETASYFDNTCLFMLQLACILTMQHGWKSHTELRVFLCVKAVTDSSAVKEKKLSAFLKQLRIQAKIVIVSFEHLYQHLNSSLESPASKSSPYSGEPGHQMNDYAQVPDDYLRAVNSLLQANSSRAAVSFFYLPRPPLQQKDYIRYLSQLASISDLTHPAVFVHGLHPVTSTTL